MALTPRSDDPNRKNELRRKSDDPASFGVGRIIARSLKDKEAPQDPDANKQPSRLDVILEGIAAMEPDDPEQFTNSGLPKVEFLEALVGLPNITSAERDEAWSAYQTGRG